MQAQPLLLPLFRTSLQGELLAWLFLHPVREYSLTELAGQLGASQSTVSREADRMIAAGIVTGRRRGNLRLLQADMGTPVSAPLAELLSLTFGPRPVLAELLAGVTGISQAFLYGSWAARYRGEPGAVPADIDVLVIGDADEDNLYDVARQAEPRLGREVNVRRVSEDAWEHVGSDPFLMSVRSRPLVELELGRPGHWGKAKRKSTG